jgi:hypothetical protein
VNAIGHFYGLHVIGGPGPANANVAVHLDDPLQPDLVNVSLGPDDDCRSYPHTATNRSQDLMIRVVVHSMSGWAAVEDLGTDLNGHIVVVVHDRILDLFGLATQTVIVPAPSQQEVICFPSQIN